MYSCVQQDQSTTDNPLSKSVKFSSKRQAIVPNQKLSHLQLDSSFEGGNLEKGFISKEKICYLLLQDDTKTQGQSYWFHFSVVSTSEIEQEFTIVNFTRPLPIFGHFIVNIDSETFPVAYSCLQTSITNPGTGRPYWSASFSYKLRPLLLVSFSLSTPYPHSKLYQHLSLLRHHKKVTVENIGKTIGGASIEVLKIGKARGRRPKLIIVTARQHPCQTVSSLVCESLLDYLVSSKGAAFLEKYRVLVIPMVNIDGVIRGNSRANLMGYDPNRCWDKMSPHFQGENQTIWNYLTEVVKIQGKAVWAIDLHGHSQEEGFLAYFNQKNEKTVAMTQELKRGCSLFRPDRCQFNIPAAKKESIRVQLQTRKLANNAVTIETSFFGGRNEQGRLQPFRPEDFAVMATKILESVEKAESIATEKEAILGSRKLTITDIDEESTQVQAQKRVPRSVSEVKKSTDNRRSSEETFRQIIYRRKMKRDSIIDRQTQVNSMKSLLRQVPAPALPQRQAMGRTSSSIQANSAQIYNITFRKNRVKTEMTKYPPADRSPSQCSYRKSEQLHQSLDMRRKIRMAFEHRLKTGDKQENIPSSRLQAPIEYPTTCRTQTDFHQTIQPCQIRKNLNRVCYRRYNQPQFRLTSGAFPGL